MSATTKINWTDATWNPVTGCTPAGVGCAHCYAKRVAERFPAVHGVEFSSESLTSTATRPVPFSTVICHPERLCVPTRWRKPRAIMCPSMGDLFHEDVLGAFKFEVWKVWNDCPQHTFIVLTKRPEQMREDMLGLEPPANVVLGVSCSTQAEADHAIPILLNTPANRRIVSLEPLVGPVDLRNSVWCQDCHGDGFAYVTPVVKSACERCGGHEDAAGCGIEPGALDGVIVGGETGPGARPMHPDWVRSLRDQCAAAGVPFFFKQWGAWLPGECVGPTHTRHKCVHEWEDGWTECSDDWVTEQDFGPLMYHAPRSSGQRYLDGKTHDELCWDVRGKGEA